MKYYRCALLSCLLMLSACSGQRPATLGVNEGRLTPCPDAPKCVSSQSDDPDHYIEPLRYKGSLTEAREKLLLTLGAMKRMKVIREQDDYLYVEFASAFFRFVDDVEFFFNHSEHLIHVRSSARFGHWDLGANRKRLERIRAEFSALSE